MSAPIERAWAGGNAMVLPIGRQGHPIIGGHEADDVPQPCRYSERRGRGTTDRGL